MYNLALIPGNDGFLGVPRPSITNLRGTLIKFNNSDFYVSGGECFNGVSLVAIAVWCGWVRWLAGRPAENRETKDRDRHPKREELGYDDPSQWEAGLDGDPTDPWRDTRHLFLVDQKTGMEYTFTTNSDGGRSAIASLCQSIANVREAYPRACPIVELHSEKMKTKYGPRPKPKFDITGWVGADGKPVVKQRPPTSTLIDDEIPF